jgi:hypothetical protein
MKHLKIVSLLSLALLFAGCAGIVTEPIYNGDAVLVHAEQSVTAAHTTLHEFLQFVGSNPKLATKYPELAVAAKTIAHGEPQWKASFDHIRAAYIANATQPNHTALDEAVAVFVSAAAEASAYLVQYSTPNE